MMKNSALSPDLLRLTLATLFSAVGDHLSEIAAPARPKSLADHLMALFMAVAEFYHASDLAMPAELMALLKDMRRAAHSNQACTLELMRAVDVISHRESLRNDAGVRVALSAANVALLAVHP